VHNLLQQILNHQQITTLFQPIFDVELQEIVGYEALSRGPQGSPLHAASTLFEVATQCGCLSQLELLTRNLAIERFAAQKLSGKLFLNVSPMLLTDPKHPHGELLKIVNKVGLSCDRVIIEISEQYPIFSSELLHQALARYRNYGFSVAIDDLGAGYAGLKEWSYLRPDIVKIDRYFVDGCNLDIVKREFLRTIFELGKATSTQVIAEGIECKEEFELLCELGMIYAQGFLLAKPAVVPTEVFPSIEVEKPTSYQHNNSAGTIKQLASSSTTCDITEKIGTLYKILVANPKIQCIPVLQNQIPVGLVNRHQLMERFSDIYGHALLAGKSIDEFMDLKPVVLDQLTSLDQASLFITQRNDEEFSQYFIITAHDQYLGIASSRELLRRITEVKIENARYANPLTMLPGNVPIEKEIDYLLTQQQSFQLAYVDVDHFKPFNDVYGYAVGDLLLKLLAQIIRSNCRRNDIFVGHIGGDDFIILFKHGNSQAICENILADFKQQTLQFFDRTAIDNQGYLATSRNGEQLFFELVSLSIGVVSPDVCCFRSHVEISHQASEAKKQAKKIKGNSLFYCRRHQQSNALIMAEKSA